MNGTRDPVQEATGAIMTMEKERERALFLSLLAAIAPVVPKLVASVFSGSVTLYASTLKTVNEAVATLVAWLIARKMARGDPGIYDYGMGKLENIARVLTGGLMLVSIVILVVAALYRILFPALLGTGGVLAGIVILVVIIATNIYFWMRNYRIAVREPSPLMDSQWRLFRMKAFANIVVLVTLVIATLCSGYPWAVYIDPIGSFFVIALLLQSGWGMISKSLPDLLDRTLEEELQLVVMKELAEHFHLYEQLHGLRSRRSGGNIYIEIFLGFDGEIKMCEVQEVIDRIKISLEAKIPKSSVNIIPTSGRCGNGRV